MCGVYFATHGFPAYIIQTLASHVLRRTIQMQEFTATLETRDGQMPVEVFHPDLGTTYPGVVFYMDVFGLREELRDMCRRYATAGYAVFMPNMFYRQGGPSFAPANKPADTVDPEAQRLNQATTTAMSADDTAAIFRYADQMPSLSVPVWGTVGYCMGGRHAMKSAAAHKQQVNAAVSLHGGQMVRDAPDSTERLIEQIDGKVYFGFAKNDPTCPDAHQKIIADALAASTTTGRVEYYDAAHGWTFPDRHCFHKAAADRAWENVFHLFRTRLWDAL